MRTVDFRASFRLAVPGWASVDDCPLFTSGDAYWWSQGEDQSVCWAPEEGVSGIWHRQYVGDNGDQ